MLPVPVRRKRDRTCMGGQEAAATEVQSKACRSSFSVYRNQRKSRPARKMLADIGRGPAAHTDCSSDWAILHSDTTVRRVTNVLVRRNENAPSRSQPT